MRRRRVSEAIYYPEIRAERWGKEEREFTLVKKHPKYIFSSSRNAALIHRIREVRLRWWTYGPGGHYLLRLQTPRMFAECYCGMSFRLHDTSAQVCEIPAPDAVLCAMCHGQGRNFPRGRKHEVSMSLAKIRKGCLVKGS